MLWQLWSNAVASIDRSGALPLHACLHCTGARGVRKAAAACIDLHRAIHKPCITENEGHLLGEVGRPVRLGQVVARGLPAQVRDAQHLWGDTRPLALSACGSCRPSYLQA